MKIKLFTRDGGFVRDGMLPPFLIPPEVISWGARVFVLDATQMGDADDPTHYKEGMLYPLDVADFYFRSTGEPPTVEDSQR